VTNGCYLFSGLIKEFYLFRDMIKELVVDFWGFTPSVGWIWVLPHQWYIFFGLYPIRGLFEGLYPHPWFVWRALSPSVVLLKGFTPTVCWFISRDVTPNKECWVFVLRCRATSFLDLPNLVSTVLPLYYPRSFIHVRSFMHTNIIHAWLHCQSYFNYTESVIRNIIRKVTNQVYLKWQAPKAACYQCILVSPVFSPV